MALIRLADLAMMHPRLLWTDIASALAIVVGELKTPSTELFELTVQDVSGFGTAELKLQFDLDGQSHDQLASLQRTYEASRLVELAAIAVAGIGLHLAGGHEIRDVALRGSRADYLVDDANHLLEVAGRSRRADFNSAWQERCQRLSDSGRSGYYVCVSEFETMTGTLAFFE